MMDQMHGWRVHLLSPDGHGNEVIIDVTDFTADLLPQVLARPDAAEALDFILAQDEGGPSCGCGGQHWACTDDMDDEEDEDADADED